jgi:hypothetical protein
MPSLQSVGSLVPNAVEASLGSALGIALVRCDDAPGASEQLLYATLDFKVQGVSFRLLMAATRSLAGQLFVRIGGTDVSPDSRELLQEAVNEALNLIGGYLAGLCGSVGLAVTLGTPRSVMDWVSDGGCTDAWLAGNSLLRVSMESMDGR